MTFFEYFPDAGFGLILIVMLPVAFISCLILQKAMDMFNKAKPKIARWILLNIYHDNLGGKIG